jgi:2,4-dienoyl-CoA reductase-like NADH-dependent reductase (Old Yellow Enzyme family)/thioredoxin reductase
MPAGFPNLFSPIKIGGKTAKNRLGFPAHGVPALGFMNDDSDGTGYIAYQVARARGGCALNIIGSIGCYDQPIKLGPTPVSPPTPSLLVPRLQRLSEGLHEYSAIGLIQLYIYSESYLYINSINTWGFTAPASQQESVSEWQNFDGEDLEKKVELFARYAKLCKDGNMDGIEVHACHGDLVQQSWSTWSNHRSDKWGEPMYFANQILEAIKATCGKDFLVSVRIPGDDFSYNGMDNKANAAVAHALEETGNVDLINVSCGNGGSSYAYTVGSMYIPAGSIGIPLASGIKQAIKSIPVMATSRFNDPALAEKAIADGHCDMVGMVRAHLADPEFGNKAREGRAEDIRMCIACNQACWDGGGAANCAQNATSAREATRFGTITRAEKKKKVIIVGGGPGGMEAARVAAIRGHDVTLYEKQPQLGGAINVLSKAPGREEFNQVTRFLTAQINKLGVTVRLGIEATVDLILQEKPDAVFLATGSTPYILMVPGSNQTNVVSPYQVLNGEVEAGDNVIVYESTGHQEGPTVAEYLAEKGKSVEYFTYFPVINTYWGLQMMNIGTHIPIVWARLKAYGIRINPLSTIKQIEGKNVTIADVITAEERVIEGVDTVVMATGYRSEKSLYKALKGKVSALYRVGDCKLPRRYMEAIHEAYETAFDI